MAMLSPSIPRLADLGTDLLRVCRVRVVASLLLPFALAGGYFAFASFGLWVPAVLAVVALSFVTYGSVSHDLVHNALGLPRRWNDVLLTLIELLTLRSGRAYRLVHLHHHARFPRSDDVEGAAAHGSLGGAILRGVVYVPHLWLWAVRHRPADRPRLLVEGTACFTLSVGGIGISLLGGSMVPAVYVLLVHLGTWVYPLILAYLPHTPDESTILLQTKRFRGRVASTIAFGHLYHLEHHLYPRVPHHNWPELARRLDRHLDHAGVPTVRIVF
jgi:beta-carotene hydroxylase